jgi:hypothetical protein
MIMFNDGGPAFPCGSGDMRDPAGMTLRDYFAAAALGHIPKLLDVQERNLSVSNIAAWAYEIADAMIAEREKRRANQPST